jgi:hypothetical protein
MQGRFEKVAIVMPWMKLDTLRTLLPMDRTSPLAQEQLLPILHMITSQIPPAAPSADVGSVLRDVSRSGLEGVMQARMLNDAWHGSIVAQTRQQQRKLVQWAVPQLSEKWRDTWDDAGTAGAGTPNQSFCLDQQLPCFRSCAV